MSDIATAQAGSLNLPPWSARQRAAVLVLALLLGVLLFYHLDFFPPITFDEGGHLHVPKTLVLYGQYARKSSDGFRYYGPTVATGPTVMLPIALSFKLFGIGLFQARVVISLYTVAMLVVFYKVTARLFGRTTAIAALFIVLTAPGIVLSKFEDGGRRVFGEVPALFFLLCGVYLWWRALDRPSLFRLMLAGLCWGLACVTKNHFLLIIVPAFLVVGVLGRYYYRTIRLRDAWLPTGVCVLLFAAWYALQLLYLGGQDFRSNLESIRSSAGNSFLVFDASLIIESIRFLTAQEVFYGWLVPGVIYAVALSLERNRAGLERAALASVVLIWLTWYAVASIGWVRYAFPALVLASIFVSRLFHDVTGRFYLPHRSDWAEWLAGRNLLTAIQAAMTVFFLFIVIRPLQQELRDTLTASDHSQEQFAAYLDEHIDHSAVIETFEYGMGFLTNHNYHYPPEWVLQVAIAHTVAKRGPAPYEEYDSLSANPDYLIVGPFVKGGVEMYSPDFLPKHWVWVTSVGPYDLYRRIR